jgi:inosine/xanthosine triphosphatase
LETQIIVVGSTRKPKLGAVQQAIAAFAADSLNSAQVHGSTESRASAQSLASGQAFVIEGVEVESGVNHTPLSREESMRGARQRVETLQEIARREGKSWRYFVGLEGGLDSVIENGERHVFLENYAFVSDGVRGYFGRSGAVELPQPLMEEVFVRGTELSIAIDAFAGAVGIRDAQGAWGILTGNKITRQEAFRVAVIAAFAPFFNAPAYGENANSASNQ